MFLGARWALDAPVVSPALLALLVMTAAALRLPWRSLGWLGVGALLVVAGPRAGSVAGGDRVVEGVFVRTGPWTENAMHGRVVPRVDGRLLWARHGNRILRPAGTGRFEWRGSSRPPPFVVTRFRGVLRVEDRPAGRRVRRSWSVSCKSDRLIDPLSATPGFVLAIRDRLSVAAAGEWVSEAGRNLAMGILLGDRGRMPDAWNAALRRYGLGHLAAVSGLHVGLFGALLWWWLPARSGRTRIGSLLIGVWLYALVSGARPAAMRAAAMISLAGVAGSTGRRVRPLDGLAFAVLTILLLDVSGASDAGLLLSGVSTAGILVFHAAVRGDVRKTGRMARALGVSASAQWASLPLTIPLFGSISPAAAVLNLMAGPWIVAVVVCGFLWAALRLTFGSAGPVELLLGGLATLLELTTEGPRDRVFFRPHASAWIVVVPFAATGLWLLGRVRWACLLLMPALVWVPVRPLPLRFGMTAIDVGQGDAILLRDGTSVLMVDGGGFAAGDVASTRIVPALGRLGIERVEVVVVTHPDSDHCKGVEELLRYLPVQRVRAGSRWSESDCVGRVRRQAAGSFRKLDGRARFRWRGWTLEALPDAPRPGADVNDRSLVVRATAGGRSILLTGDIGEARERQLGRRCRGCLEVDILKVAHHGSRFSTSEGFVARASPSWAVISVARQSVHGHPAESVLDRLHAVGAWVLRTDVHGDIDFGWNAAGPVEVSLREPSDW